MSERLDDLFVRMAAQPADRDLQDLESRIGRTIQSHRLESATVSAIAPVRVAAVSLALALGMTAGVAFSLSSGREPHSYSAFSPVGHLAPSTLLEGGE
jgi:hypothetical protein